MLTPIPPLPVYRRLWADVGDGENNTNKPHGRHSIEQPGDDAARDMQERDESLWEQNKK